MITKKDFEIVMACLATKLALYSEQNKHREITTIDIIEQIRHFSFEDMKVIKRQIEEQFFNERKTDN